MLKNTGWLVTVIAAVIIAPSAICLKAAGQTGSWRPVPDSHKVGKGNQVSYRVNDDGMLQLRNDSPTKGYFDMHWKCGSFSQGKGVHLKPGEEADLQTVNCNTSNLQQVWLDYFAKDR